MKIEIVSVITNEDVLAEADRVEKVVDKSRERLLRRYERDFSSKEKIVGFRKILERDLRQFERRFLVCRAIGMTLLCVGLMICSAVFLLLSIVRFSFSSASMATFFWITLALVLFYVFSLIVGLAIKKMAEKPIVLLRVLEDWQSDAFELTIIKKDVREAIEIFSGWHFYSFN